MGPFSEETTHSFLKQGGIARDDLAWTPGLAEWTPLAQVLLFSATPSLKSAPVSESPAGEPATAKQKALLSYLGIPFSTGATKETAALLVNEAMENPRLNARVLQWNDDRLALHPEMFAAEAQEKKNARAAHFFESCQNEGSDRLMGVTPAHCQVLVTYLDVNFPNWDANPSEAAWNYFFPAVAEKFPHLVRKPWRGKLRFPDGPRVAAELRHGLPPAASPRTSSPFSALVRGIALGLALLLVIYVGFQMLPHEKPVGEIPPPVPPTRPVTPVREPVPEKTAEAAAEEQPKEVAMIEPTQPVEMPPADPTPDPTPAVAAPKVFLVITKPISAQAQYGFVKLTAGQSLKILSREGTKVKALLNAKEILTIPIEATDLVTPPPAP